MHLLMTVFFLAGLGQSAAGPSQSRPATTSPSVASTPSLVERVADDVCVVRDDAGNWSEQGVNMTHQRGDRYCAMKVLDLSNVPTAQWNATTEVRLSAFFCVRDYSWHDAKQSNGLDKTVEIAVNGHLHAIPDRNGLPRYVEGKAMSAAMRWHDMDFPKPEFVRGRNEITLRIVPPQGKPADDYLYLGIDTSVPTRNSWLRLDPKAPWRQDRLNTIGAHGEYMVRLYLLRGPRDFTAVWLPAQQTINDPSGILEYAGSYDGLARLEWNPLRLDASSSVSAEVEIRDSRSFEVQWLSGDGEPLGRPVKAKGPRFEARLSPPLAQMPGGVQWAGSVPLTSVTLKAAKGFHAVPPPLDMAPRIEPPAGKAVEQRPSCLIDADKILLVNDNLRCQFSRKGSRLQLVSLVNEIAAAEMVRSPADCALAVVEMGGQRYAAARDFVCRSVTAGPQPQGFTAVLFCKAAQLEAALSVWIDASLHWGLVVTNRGEKPADFKTAFPHLSGLAISADPADDYYFYPMSCTVSDAAALIRQGYGDYQALYQLMEIFSPRRGAGLSVECSDDDGRYKVLALRKKTIPGKQETSVDNPRTPTAEEFKWTNSLPPVPGVGLTWEYLRRTRAPGQSFAAKDVAIQAHAGDWHVAMRRYAQRCHEVWKYRPYPSRLTSLWNMPAVGWGQDLLFRDGKYRTDFLKPDSDCVELMSWWDWSPLGPHGIPLDQFAEKMGPAKLKGWKSYFVKDPVTGAPMFNNNPGDYDGYNERFGGLAALREAIRTYQKAGHLVTLYTDPFRVDDNTRCGRRWGRLFGVVQPDGKYRTDYDAWRMCHDVAEYRQWVAQTMARVIRETGADGVRLDEYGHCGSACFSTLHKHTFAEWGCTEWQRGVAETVKLVRQAMDQVAPRSVLTTEHPGYDFLMPNLDGCITYDLTVLASPLRPLECNLQRFYFPECKAWELDHRGADRAHRKRFWNAVGSFGAYYPDSMVTILRENEEAFASRDCDPLIPTLKPRLYANRFRSPEKTVYMLYNSSGHSVIGALLKVQRQPGQHVVELLSRKEVQCLDGPDGTVATLFMARADVACLACLPSRIAVKRDGKGALIVSAPAGRRFQIVVGDKDGKRLALFPITKSPLTIVGNQLPPGATPVWVKLLDGSRLVDLQSMESLP